MDNAILISRNVRLTFKLTAKAIYVTGDGEIIISLLHYGPKTQIPMLSVGYLEALCSQFYFGGYSHQNAIADILLLNGYIRAVRYGEFYNALRSNLEEQRVTIISSELSL